MDINPGFEACAEPHGHVAGGLIMVIPVWPHVFCFHIALLDLNGVLTWSDVAWKTLLWLTHHRLWRAGHCDRLWSETNRIKLTMPYFRLPSLSIYL